MQASPPTPRRSSLNRSSSDINPLLRPVKPPPKSGQYFSRDMANDLEMTSYSSRLNSSPSSSSAHRPSMNTSRSSTISSPAFAPNKSRINAGTTEKSTCTSSGPSSYDLSNIKNEDWKAWSTYLGSTHQTISHDSLQSACRTYYTTHMAPLRAPTSGIHIHCLYNFTSHSKREHLLHSRNIFISQTPPSGHGRGCANERANTGRGGCGSGSRGCGDRDIRRNLPRDPNAWCTRCEIQGQAASYCYSKYKDGKTPNIPIIFTEIANIPVRYEIIEVFLPSLCSVIFKWNLKKTCYRSSS